MGGKIKKALGLNFSIPVFLIIQIFLIYEQKIQKELDDFKKNKLGDQKRIDIR